MDEYRHLIYPLIAMVVILGGVLGACSYLIWVERKLSAWMQDRIGPNRVGPFGLLQPIADGIKFLLKEDVIPAHVDKVLYVMAPAIAVFTALLALAVVPFGPQPSDPDAFPFIIAPNVDIGLLFILAVGSLNVYAVILGGWASNNKYSMIGGLRASAQVISYEIPLGLSILGVVILSGSLNLETIIAQQVQYGVAGWNVWYQPLAALIFFTAALAESNRLPFDLPECEQELVGGFHTEYSALKFGLFFVGEYTHMLAISFLVAILFLGGWHFPWIAEPDSAYAGAVAVKVAVLLTKVVASIVFMMLLRWTIPRFRFDQLMGLTWKVLLPLALCNVLAMMIVKQFDLPLWWMTIVSLVLFIVAGAISLRPTRRPTPVRRPASAAVIT